jgi:hypothetical protein
LSGTKETRQRGRERERERARRETEKRLTCGLERREGGVWARETKGEFRERERERERE